MDMMSKRSAVGLIALFCRAPWTLLYRLHAAPLTPTIVSHTRRGGSRARACRRRPQYFEGAKGAKFRL